MRAGLDRDAREVLSEAVGDLQVAEVVHEPERDLGDFRRKRLELDAEELRDVHLAERGDVQHQARVVAVDLLQDVRLEAAELAVGDEEEVAAAAGRVEERERGEPVVERGEARLLRLAAQGADRLKLVA